MKRSFLISLTIIVFLFTGGFSFAVSFCPMSEEWSFAFFSDKACSCDGEEEEDCCDQTVIKLNKIQDNFVPSLHVKVPTIKAITFDIIFSEINYISFVKENKVVCFAPDDPPPISTPTYIFNRVLII